MASAQTAPLGPDDNKDKTNARSGLESYERDSAGRPPWLLTYPEVKLLGIAGVGFFLDGMCIKADIDIPILLIVLIIAYDLFIINVRTAHNSIASFSILLIGFNHMLMLTVLTSAASSNYAPVQAVRRPSASGWFTGAPQG